MTVVDCISPHLNVLEHIWGSVSTEEGQLGDTVKYNAFLLSGAETKSAEQSAGKAAHQ